MLCCYAPNSIATTPGVGEGATPFPGLLYFTLDTYLIMLSDKQGGIKYNFSIFGMTWPGIEPLSPGPLANSLPTRPMIYTHLCTHTYEASLLVQLFASLSLIDSFRLTSKYLPLLWPYARLIWTLWDPICKHFVHEFSRNLKYTDLYPSI